MNKVKFKNSRGRELVGLFYPASAETLIVMCHGFTGDKSEWGKFDKTAEKLYDEGYSVIRFDFSGCGESEDEFLTLDNQIDDLKNVLSTYYTYPNVGIVGLSFGGLVAAKVNDPKIKTHVWWAPVTDKTEGYGAGRFTSQQLEEMGSAGFTIMEKDRGEGKRNSWKIPSQMIKDREEIDQQELLSQLKEPILIIHGDADERVPVEHSRNAMQYLSEDSRLEVFEGAGHTFEGYEDRLIDLTVEWIKEHLPRQVTF